MHAMPMRKILLMIMLALGAFVATAAPQTANHGIETSATAASTAIKVRTAGVDIVVDGEQPVQVQIYAITGQLVTALEAPAGEVTSIELPAGCYIVRAGDASQRVVIR